MKYLTKISGFLAASVFLMTVTICPAGAFPEKPYPPRLVNDLAGILYSYQKIALEQKLSAFSDTTSNQIAVVTVNDLEGYSPAEYGTEIGIRWKVGSSEFDNGIVVLVKPKTADSQGQVNISVGYGLEGAIPDSYAKRIIDNEMIPYFQTGDYYAGIDRACTVLMKLASGEISEPSEKKDNGASYGMYTFLFLMLLVILLSRRKGGGGNDGNGGRRKFVNDKEDFIKGLIIGNILSGSGHDRHSGGFTGGFGPGSFGGGFSSGGFGGFGGGDFGGGGASGNW